MNFQELKLNRFMYKSAPTEEADSAQYMSSAVYSRKEQASKTSSEKDKKDAREIITGTVITACLIKSSDQGDRIEIGQDTQSLIFREGVDLGGSQGVDYLAAYRDGIVTILITGQGVTYLDYVLPKTKWINLEGGTSIRQNGQIIWTVAHIGTGEYQINHNLGTLNYSAVVTPNSDVGWLAGAMSGISFKTANTFVINIFDDTGTPIDQDWDCMVQINPE